MNVSPASFVLFSLMAAALGSQTTWAQILLREKPPLTHSEQSLVPKNLARWHMGSCLILTDKDGMAPGARLVLPHGPKTPEGALINDDDTDTLNLRPGKHTFIVDLGTTQIVDRFYLHVFEGRGSIAVKVSDTLENLDHPSWLNFSREISFSESTPIQQDTAPVEARYVAFCFTAEDACEVGALGIAGTLSVAHTLFANRLGNREVGTNPANLEREDLYDYNFASLHSGARVRFLTGEPESSQAASLIIDNDATTYLTLDSEQKLDALIIDLDESTFINRISLLLKPVPGRLRFFALDRLPQDEETAHNSITPFKQWTLGNDQPLMLAQASVAGSRNLRAVIAEGNAQTTDGLVIDNSFFEEQRPLFDTILNEESDRIRFPINNLSTRYLLLVWEPDMPNAENPLRIYELGVFGPVPASDEMVATAPVSTMEEAPSAPAAAGTASRGGDGDGGETPLFPRIPPVSAL